MPSRGACGRVVWANCTDLPLMRKLTFAIGMANKRNLRVTKWIGVSPIVAVCTACGREFRVPLTEIKSTARAQESLQLQFNQHKCIDEG